MFFVVFGMKPRNVPLCELFSNLAVCGLILSRVQAVHSNAGLICLLMPCTPWVIVCQPFLTLCLNNVTDIDCLGTKKLSIA